MRTRERPISEIMRTEFVSLTPQDKLDFADEIMQLGRIRHFPVLEGKKLAGIVSQRDLLAASLTKVLDFEGSQRRSFLRAVEVAEVMTRDVRTVRPDSTLSGCAQLMVQHKIGCLPVVDESGAPIGLVTEADLLRAAYLEDD